MKRVSTVSAKQGKKFSQPTLTIGLDLGDRNSWHCVVDESGQIYNWSRELVRVRKRCSKSLAPCRAAG